MSIKKYVYISAFAVFGILLQFLLHEIVEIWYIGLLLADFPKYSLGFSWNSWVMLHHVMTVVLLSAGIFFGFWQGKYWWRRIYEEKTFEKKYQQMF